MQAPPHVNPESSDAPRVTLSKPNVYFPLDCPFATIVGMYTNVTEGGSIDSVQRRWLTNEFATAAQGIHRCAASPGVLVRCGSRRQPRTRGACRTWSHGECPQPPANRAQPGGGKYNSIYRVGEWRLPPPAQAVGAAMGTVDAMTQAKLVAGYNTSHGYMTLRVEATSISGQAFAVGAAWAAIRVRASSDLPRKKSPSKAKQPKLAPGPAPLV